MRKLFVSACAILMAAISVSAQEAATQSYLDSLRNEVDMLKQHVADNDYKENQKSVWKRTKFMNIAYVNQSITDESQDQKVKYKSQFGVSFNLGNTYYLHRAIAGVLRFGLDAVWTDINYAKYKDANIDLNIPDSGNINEEDINGDYDLGEFDLGMHQLEVGIGLGPAVNVAPFGKKTNGLKSLRVQAYFHFLPSYSALIMTEDGETSVHHGFCPMFTAGGNIQYKIISLGVEARWGSAKYKGASFDSGDSEGGDSADEKVKYKTSATRVYLRFCF